MKYVISKPIVDLRKQPEELLPLDFSHNNLRESQLLLGEKVHVLETSKKWVYIQALEQEKYTKAQGWHFYPGWVLKEEISPLEDILEPTHVICKTSHPYSYGTYLHLDSKQQLWFLTGHKVTIPLSCRSLHVSPSTALSEMGQFVGAPYLWGGKASYLSQPISSVDCSGLVHLLYKSLGILIPRDAHDQWLKCKTISHSNLLPGDCIFRRPEKNERVSHVGIFLGFDKILEAPQSGENVRIVPLEKFKKQNFEIFEGRIMPVAQKLSVDA